MCIPTDNLVQLFVAEGARHGSTIQQRIMHSYADHQPPEDQSDASGAAKPARFSAPAISSLRRIWPRHAFAGNTCSRQGWERPSALIDEIGNKLCRVYRYLDGKSGTDRRRKIGTRARSYPAYSTGCPHRQGHRSAHGRRGNSKDSLKPRRPALALVSVALVRCHCFEMKSAPPTALYSLTRLHFALGRGKCTMRCALALTSSGLSVRIVSALARDR